MKEFKADYEKVISHVVPDIDRLSAIAKLMKKHTHAIDPEIRCSVADMANAWLKSKREDTSERWSYLVDAVLAFLTFCLCGFDMQLDDRRKLIEYVKESWLQFKEHEV